MGRGSEHMPQKLSADSLATNSGVHANIQEVRLADHVGDNRVSHKRFALTGCPEAITVLETVEEYRFAPRIRITLQLCWKKIT